MLFYLFAREELQPLFERLGYEYDPETARRNVAYYDQRTSHGATLSLVTHAGVLATLDPQSSWDRFVAALKSDVGDIQGGTAKEGIHMGVMANRPIRVAVGSEVRELCPGEHFTFPLAREPSGMQQVYG